ncbi:MAG: SprT family zinc-dependent metalloprotease [Niameybacter sp.]|uniref:M48 family metallopeptidase n=1 Tax=Niameybacter sp. TaxID=2033640 RepID=UPI002FCC82DE
MYTLVRQKRKTMTISIQDDLTVLVKAPIGITKQSIDVFVSKHQDWIEKTIQAKTVQANKRDWLSNGEILYLGSYRKVYIEEKLGVSPNVCVAKEQFIITTPNKNDTFLIKKQVETYTKEQALELVTQFVQMYSHLLGCQYKSITIRKQKTRWGSCSAKGALSFNVRLMGAPLDVISYVALHEVAHLIHFDHSVAFWHTIEAVIPDYKIRQDYLKKHANILDI